MQSFSNLYCCPGHPITWEAGNKPFDCVGKFPIILDDSWILFEQAFSEQGFQVAARDDLAKEGFLVVSHITCQTLRGEQNLA
jgi:hypothetical protein